MALYSNGWGVSENGPRPTPDPRVCDAVRGMAVSVQMPMRCGPAVFWDLVTTVERIGEFSPECAEAWWVVGFPAHEVGGRFEGRNRVQGDGETYEWTRPCDVVAYDAPHRFAYTVGDRFDGTPATRWTFEITPTDVGCVVHQQFEHLADGLSGLRLEAERAEDPEGLIAMRREQLQAGMTQTLERMRSILEDG